MTRIQKKGGESTGSGPGAVKDPPGLTLTATPIGYLGDLSPRARRSIEEADILACEDTRHTGRMLKTLGIGHGKLVAYHDHNRDGVDERLVGMMLEGKSVTLVSNAGTPVVSDPGFSLVRLCREAGLPVTAVPGPSAAVTALVLSGLPADRFSFGGFLPQQAGKRRRELEEALDAGRGGRAGTRIYYESPKRILATLGDIAGIAPDRMLAVARELTKLHEEVVGGTAGELIDRLGGGSPPKGEIVLLVAPAGAAARPDGAVVGDLLRRALADGNSRRDAASLVAKATGMPRREVYGIALGLDDGEGG